jgi:hypothetical protein
MVEGGGQERCAVVAGGWGGGALNLSVVWSAPAVVWGARGCDVQVQGAERQRSQIIMAVGEIRGSV